VFCVMQHITFTGTKIKYDLSRYNWPCGVILLYSNSVSALRQVSIVSHFSNLILDFLREVSYSLGVAWPYDQEVPIIFYFLLDANLVITWSRNPHAKTWIPGKPSKSSLIGVWHKDNFYLGTSTIENGKTPPNKYWFPEV
jgi:hypothetical protein